MSNKSIAPKKSRTLGVMLLLTTRVHQNFRFEELDSANRWILHDSHTVGLGGSWEPGTAFSSTDEHVGESIASLARPPTLVSEPLARSAGLGCLSLADPKAGEGVVGCNRVIGAYLFCSGRWQVCVHVFWLMIESFDGDGSGGLRPMLHSASRVDISLDCHLMTRCTATVSWCGVALHPKVGSGRDRQALVSTDLSSLFNFACQNKDKS